MTGDQRQFGVGRRTVLKGILASPLAGTALYDTVGRAAAASGSGNDIVVEQGGTQFTIDPLSNGQSVEEFYADDGTTSNTGFERSDACQLFVWDGPDGPSLGVVTDAADGSGGSGSLGFEGLPSGEWVVQDDPSAFGSVSDPSPDWSWGGDETAGGAYRGEFDGFFDVTVDPDFDSGIDELYALEPGERSYERRDLFRVKTRWGSDVGRGWETIEVDVSEYAGEEIDLELYANGRWTFVDAWVKVDFIEIDGVFEEQFDDLEGWTCTNQPRSGGYDDTPTDGFCKTQDGYAFVKERSNRTRRLSRRVELPESGDLTLRARCKAWLDGRWSHAGLRVVGWEDDVRNPERHALDPTEPVTIRREGAKAELQGLLDEKDDQITTLRGVASPPVPASTVDADAAEFVDTVRENIDGFDAGTTQQYTEAMDRLTAAERVTEAAAAAPRRDARLDDVYDDPPITPDDRTELLPRIGKGLTSAIIALASRGLGKLAGKIGGVKFLGKVKKFVVRRVHSAAEKLMAGLIAKGIVSNSLANRILFLADRLARDLGDILAREDVRNKIFDVTKTTVQDGISEGYVEVPADVDVKISEIRETVDEFLADLAYVYYFVNTDVAEVALPTGDDFTLPEELTEASLDLPDEHLPDYPPFSWVPDEISYDVDIDGALPEPDAYTAYVEMASNPAFAAVEPAGLDPTLDEGLADLESAVEAGSLAEQDPATRQDLTDLLVEGVDLGTGITEEAIDKVDAATQKGYGVEHMVMSTVMGAMTGSLLQDPEKYGIRLAIQSLLKLAEFVVNEVIVSTVVTFFSLLASSGWLLVLDKAHLLGTRALLDTDLSFLSEVDLDL